VSDRDIREKFLPRLAALLPAGQKVRLPTEAEWEYAARAGANTAFAAGADETALAKSGWYIANANGSPRPAGTLAANAWGLLDMHGNAAEICEDAYEADFYGRSPGTDPLNSADAPLRVVRGGGWAHLPEHCRSAYRLYAHRENRYDFLGFRIAVVLPE